MAFALTSIKAYGVEAEEPLNKDYKQYLEANITGLATDIDLDIGDYTSGTFWTAIGTSSDQAKALLLALKAIQIKAKSFTGVSGVGLSTKAAIQGPGALSLDSNASAGGAATETMTVTGLLTTDTIRAVSQFVKGANGTATIAYGNASGAVTVANQLPVEWTANPGAGAKVRVAIQRVSGVTPAAGQYAISMDSTNTFVPNLLFASGDAPLVYSLVFEWTLKANEIPVLVAA
jgi:hypothetical protein